MIDTGLKDKVVLVTGANHGIGAATAQAFATEGARVFVTFWRIPIDARPGEALYRERQAQSADEVLRSIRSRGGQTDAWEADLANSANIPELFDRVEQTFGSVDVLVNNAAHCQVDTFIPPKNWAANVASPTRTLPRLTITASLHDQHFAVNSRAAALMIAEFARRHIERGKNWGRIISVSTDGASGFTGAVSYGASKHALESYTRAAANELGRYGITANIVSLGPVQTGWMSPAMVEAEALAIPLGRIGEPEDVADVIVYFASEQARWVTGQLLYVGGGHVSPL